VVILLRQDRGGDREVTLFSVSIKKDQTQTLEPGNKKSRQLAPFHHILSDVKL
jgi:hypothetical protein